MKNLHLLAAAVLSFASLVGCAAPAGEDADSAVSDLVPLRPDQQRFAFAPKATIKANIARFEALNPTFTLDRDQVNAEPITGALQSVSNEAALGAPESIDATQAVARATGFARRNLPLLHIEHDELARATVTADPYPFESGNFPWTVSFSFVRAPAGYEGFDSVVRQVHLSIDLGKDGQVRRFYNSSTGFEGLAINTQPALAASAPALVQNIIGTELVWVDHSFVPEPDVALGAVTASDITGKTPIIHVANEAGGVVLTLAYEVGVRRGGHAFRFVVHSRTGAVLEQSQIESWE